MHTGIGVSLSVERMCSFKSSHLCFVYILWRYRCRGWHQREVDWVSSVEVTESNGFWWWHTMCGLTGRIASGQDTGDQAADVTTLSDISSVVTKTNHKLIYCIGHGVTG